MAKKGNPVTFKSGVVTMAKMANGTAANGTNFLIKSGSIEDTVAISEGASNCVGTLRAAGAASCTMSFTVYVSDTPYTPAGVDPGFLPGDLVMANVTNGMLAYGGEFIVESFKASLDPQEMTTVEMSLQSSGDLTLRKTGVVSCG